MVRFVTMAAVISFLACPVRADDAETPGIQVVESLGGSIIRNVGVEGMPVVAVRLAGTALTDRQLADLTCLTRLEQLDISRTGVSEAGLAELVKFPRLRALNLEGTPVTDASLKRFVVLEKLEDLNLAGTKVTAAGLKDLASFKALCQLVLEAGQLNDDILRVLRDTRAIGKLRLADEVRSRRLDGDGTIEYWDLSEKPISKLEEKQIASLGRYNGLKIRVSENERDLSWIALLKGLKGLIVLGPLNDAGAAQVAGMKGLQSLRLVASHVSDAGVKKLAALADLEDLDLSGSRATGACLREVARLPKLKRLTIQSIYAYDSELCELGALKGLRSLDLAGCRVMAEKGKGDANLKYPAAIAKLDRLEALYLPFTRVSDDAVKEFCRIEGLVTLYLSGPAVTDKSMKDLARLKRLRDLSLVGTSVSDAGVAELAGLPGLEVLSLDSTRVTGTAFAGADGFKRLLALGMNGTPATDAGVKAIAGLAELRDLDLNGTGISDETAASLGRLSKLRGLDLGATKADQCLADLSTKLSLCRIQSNFPSQAQVAILMQMMSVEQLIFSNNPERMKPYFAEGLRGRITQQLLEEAKEALAIQVVLRGYDRRRLTVEIDEKRGQAVISHRLVRFVTLYRDKDKWYFESFWFELPRVK